MMRKKTLGTKIKILKQILLQSTMKSQRVYIRVYFFQHLGNFDEENKPRDILRLTLLPYISYGVY